MSSEVWVIDTSSIIEIRRRLNLTKAQQEKIFSFLTKMVQDETLFFPKMVNKELGRGIDVNEPDIDLGHSWAEQNQKQATKYNPEYAEVQKVLSSHNQLYRMIDVTRPYGSDEVEDADPYVLTMAVKLRDEQNKKSKILTNDTKNKPKKISLTAAAACVDIICLPVEIFLKSQGLIESE
jgi:hypothetical protein